MNASILTWLTFLPAAGAVVVLLLPRRGRAPQVFSLLLTLFLFVMALHLPAHFNYQQQQGFQFELNIPWITNPAIQYHVGVDGLSMWLVVLVSFLAPLGVLISWRVIQDRTREFYALLLLQQTAMYGVFVALDLIPLLRILGAFDRPAGTFDRHVWPHQWTSRRHQVFPLRLHPIRPAAGRHAVALWTNWNV